MKIILQNHTEEYAVREIVSSYFPKIKLEFTDIIPDDGDYILSSYTMENSQHRYSAMIHYNRQIAEETCMEFSYNKTFLKKVLSACLKRITKIHLPWGVLTGIRPSKIVREAVESGMTFSQAKELLTKHYQTDADKADLAVSVAKTEAEIISRKSSDGISLYIGIPFCPTRCLYCSFTSQSIRYANTLMQPYMEALKKEIRETVPMLKAMGKKIETVYFGGGTPSAISEEQIKELFECLTQSMDFSSVKEITFEAGRPDTINEEKLRILKAYNISRISINPQTTNDATLEIIGRKHSTKQFFDSFALARKLNFKHINTDLIAGLPSETTDIFRKTISDISSLNPESVTVHTMCIKHGSYLDRQYNMYSLAAAETVSQMLNIAAAQMRLDDKHPYYLYRQKNMLGNLENIGYCNPGHECLYNIYIMEEIESIIALGAGGSSKLVTEKSIERVFNVKEVSEYIKRIDEMIERKRSFFAKQI